MTRNEAARMALGYALAAENFTHVRTAHVTGKGPADFAGAYAQGWEDYMDAWRADMPSVQDAYACWQESRGQSVFRPGESTAEQAKRA